KGALYDVGLALVGLRVGELVDQPRDVGELRQMLRADARPSPLQLERGDERDQVRVAAPLAEPVHRALHLHATPLERLERVRDRQLGVVVTVDAEAGGGDGTL